MEYLRDCNNTKDFEEHFLKPFVKNQVNEKVKKFISYLLDKYPNMDKELQKELIFYYNFESFNNN